MCDIWALIILPGKMAGCPSWASAFEELASGLDQLKSAAGDPSPTFENLPPTTFAASWNLRSGRQLVGSESEFLGSGRQILGSHSGYGHGCCPLVFNPSTLLALLAGIALATYFLRLVIVVENFGRSFPFNLNFGSGISANVGEFETCIFLKTIQAWLGDRCYMIICLFLWVFFHSFICLVGWFHNFVDDEDLKEFMPKRRFHPSSGI